MAGAGAAEFPGLCAHARQLDVTITGDTAKSRTICFNPMVLHTGASEATGQGSAEADAQPQVLFCGLWYEDEFVRTAEGWRMTRRVETKCFDRVV